MKTSNTVFLLFTLLFSIVFAGCDSSLAFNRIEVAELPDRTVYYVGEDTALCLDGGTVLLTTVGGETETRSMASYTYGTVELTEDNFKYHDSQIYSDVQFDKPGTYTVTIKQTGSLRCSFSVEVKERGEHP